MFYGGDYNPEQWPREVWLDDVERMREAGVNLVTLGVFSWSRIQPAEGEFDFAWLDEIIDLLHANGIAVDLATATASPPPWFHDRYPEALPRTAEGVLLGPGSRQHYAPTAPAYRRLAAELVGALADRYAQHPAVVLWHVNNEYACHVHADYSDAAADAFRDWLRSRYGDVAALNAAWGTAFWSQIYTSFDQVLPPRAAPYTPNPTQLLDFRRFTSDAFLACYLMERDIIRAAGATQPITTNFMGAFAPLDYWEWARHVDVVSDDCYPDPQDPESFRGSALARDLMRSLKPGTPWLLMEQSTNALNWRRSNGPKAPGQMAALSMQAVARGANGILFFQWRQSRAGSEKFHSAMLPHAGTDTRTWREVVALGSELGALPELATPTPAPVAIVLDWDSWWSVSGPNHPVELDYLSLVSGWHTACERLGLAVDFVRPSDDFAPYRLVIAPQLAIVAPDAAAGFASYVATGGRLVVGAYSDVVDESDRFRDGGFATQLGPILGVRVEDFGALPLRDERPEDADIPVRFAGETFSGSLLAEQIHAIHAEVIGVFEDGAPAVTRRDVGAGRGFYVATVPDGPGAELLVRHALEGTGLPAPAVWPPAVEVRDRGDLRFTINQGAATVVSTDGRELAPFEYRIEPR
jgi:beta-galactosidase